MTAAHEMQRLSRLAGVAKAVEISAGEAPINAEEALEVGIVNCWLEVARPEEGLDSGLLLICLCVQIVLLIYYEEVVPALHAVTILLSLALRARGTYFENQHFWNGLRRNGVSRLPRTRWA